ncbi:MAG: methionyl-tRNA formyltransferase [bacterium]
MDGGLILIKNNMKIIFLAYRVWSLSVYESIQRHPNIHFSILCKTQVELEKLDLNDFDLIISCGWSEELGEEILSKIKAIGVHCAELDRYSYGSPIQLQIIDGITRTKHRVFSFTYEADSPRAHTHNCLFSHEVDLDLSGNMLDILEQMTVTSKVLFRRYLDDYPNIEWKKWPAEKIIRKKREPKDSYITKEDISAMNTEELYNFFRCLESPYPNGAIEDEHGTLFIEKVRFLKNS